MALVVERRLTAADGARYGANVRNLVSLAAATGSAVIPGSDKAPRLRRWIADARGQARAVRIG